MAGHQTSMFVAVVVGRLNLRRCRISVFGRWLASLGTGFVADRLSIGRVCFVVVSQPKLGHISAITWPSRNHLVVVSRGCHSADLRYEWPFLCHLRLAADRPSVRPAPFGWLSKPSSLGCFRCISGHRLPQPLYTAVPNTLQDEVVTKT